MGHCTTKMMIKEAGGHLVFDFKSDAMPKDASQGETAFKFGEEFEWKNPFDPTDKLTVTYEFKNTIVINFNFKTFKMKCLIYTKNSFNTIDGCNIKRQ